jgi:ABC-type multidrug transport system fused ATPase/permease subunit
MLTELTAAAPDADKPRSRSGLLDLYRCIWRHAAGFRLAYVAAIVLLGVSAVLKLTIPWLAAQAINSVQVAGYAELTRAGWYVAAVFLVYLVGWTLHAPGRILERKVGMRVRASVSDTLFAKLVHLPLAWHEGQHSADIQQRTQQASGALADFAENQFVYIQNFVNVVGPLVALWLLSTAVGTAAIIGYVVIGFVIARFDRVLMRIAGDENARWRRYGAGLFDFLGNISTVLSLRLQHAARALVRGRLEDVFEPRGKSIVVNEAKWCAVDVLSAALSWSLVAFYAWSTRGESQEVGVPVLLGGLFMVYQYAQQAAGVVSSMAQNFQNVARMRTDYASAQPILQAPAQPVASAHAPADWTEIVAHNLDYRHGPAPSRHEEDHRPGVHATLTLHRGERIALIGPSGAGKSTLLRLLAGLYEPAHGYYAVDGEPAFGVRSLASIATLVQQDAEIFEATLRDNLTFGVPHDDAAIREAAYVSAFDAVIAARPEGLDTPISERGFNLSGGQRQRLALARGFLAADRDVAHGSSLLLLDEPTSALDQATEARVFRRLREKMPDVCIVASIHRMSALAQFDRVILMHAGRIVDCGTVDELLEREPLMRSLMGREAAALAA